MVQVHVLIQPGEPEETVGWKSQSVSGGEAEGRNHSGMKVPLCLSTQCGPGQPRGAQGVELDGRSVLRGWCAFGSGGKTGSDTHGLSPVPSP